MVIFKTGNGLDIVSYTKQILLMDTNY